MLAHAVQYDPADADRKVIAAKIRAIEDEACALASTATPPEPGLDVKRLAKAMALQDTRTPHSSVEWHRARAKGVAAEYARLSASPIPEAD